MKLRELKALIDGYLSRSGSEDRGEYEVVIETRNGGCPTRYMSPVKSGHCGFDWTRGKFILFAQDQLVAFRLYTDSVADIGRVRLALLKEANEKLGFKYIPKSREREWVDGFVEGFRSFALATETVAPVEVPNHGND